MIDLAILRPGRPVVKIKIERPDAEAAEGTFSKDVLAGLPLKPHQLAENGGGSNNPTHREADTQRVRKEPLPP